MSEYFTKYFCSSPEFESSEVINNDLNDQFYLNMFPSDENSNIEKDEIPIIEIDISKKITRETASNKINTNQKYLYKVLNKKRKNRRRDDFDNLLSKIEVDSNNFTLNYINYMLDIFPNQINKKFLKIEHKLKKKINKEKFEEQLKKKVSQILSQNISDKYKAKGKDFNKKLCREIEKEAPLIKKMLSQNYLTLFQKVYYPSKREINLKKIYDIDEPSIIELPKEIKMFKDKVKEFKDEAYKKELYETANKAYFEGKLKFFAFN